MNAYEYANAHRADYLDELKALLRMQSISALSDHDSETAKTAQWLADQLRGIGMTNATVHPTERHPIVTAEWLGVPGAPTVLIYGHYDVQPVDPLDLWHTPPFEPTLVGDDLFARGASDDKGQVFAHIKAVGSILKANGKLPVNVKFLIEGEEEISSVNLDPFIEAHQNLLRADVCVISDSHVLASDRPVIVYALRGLTYMEVEVHGAKSDLHSGSYGGAVYNPLQALCEIIAGLHKSDGSINVPGFYDRVRPVDPKEREALKQVPWTDAEFYAETGLRTSWGEQGYSRREQVGVRPTLEVNGIVGGFIGEGPKTVLPAKALAKISCRLVAEQDPTEIYQLIKRRVADLTPAAVTSEVRLLNIGFPAIVDLNSPAIEAASAAYERGFGAKPVYLPEGGSIPVVATIQNTFKIPVLLIGLGLPDDNLHAPNEKFKVEHFYKGIDTSIALLERLGQMTPQTVKG